MITKEMVIKDVLNQYPEALKVFTRHGLRCVGWGGALYETVEQGARAHGIDVPALMADLEKLSPTKAK